jgi:hypothetical protein
MIDVEELVEEIMMIIVDNDDLEWNKKMNENRKQITNKLRGI